MKSRYDILIETIDSSRDAIGATVLTVISVAVGGVMTGFAIYQGISHDYVAMAIDAAVSLLASWGWFWLRVDLGREGFYDLSDQDEGNWMITLFSMLCCPLGLLSVLLFDGVISIVAGLSELRDWFSPRLWLARAKLSMQDRFRKKSCLERLMKRLQEQVDDLKRKLKRVEHAIQVHRPFDHVLTKAALQREAEETRAAIGKLEKARKQVVALGPEYHDAFESALIQQCNEAQANAGLLASEIEMTIQEVVQQAKSRALAEKELNQAVDTAAPVEDESAQAVEQVTGTGR